MGSQCHKSRCHGVTRSWGHKVISHEFDVFLHQRMIHLHVLLFLSVLVVTNTKSFFIVSNQVIKKKENSWSQN